jgi:O-antigen/teichoic acid export membrane protein
MSPPHSLKRRYITKFTSNLTTGLVQVLIHSLAPRALGPGNYGNFSFLSNFFVQVCGFFDTGTSQCFYTKYSQRPEDSQLVRFYLGAIVLLGLAMLASLGILQKSHLLPIILPGQIPTVIYLTAIWGFANWYSQAQTLALDARGLTVWGEQCRIVLRLFTLFLVAGLFYQDLLNLESFVIALTFSLLVLIAALWSLLRKEQMLQPAVRHSKPIHIYFHEFFTYSHPIFLYGIVALVSGVLDRWMLQKFAGNIEQGFFGIAYQASYACSLFTMSMVPLLAREFSISHNKGDLRKITADMERFSPIFYCLAAFFSCFLSVNGQWICTVLGGKEYLAAGPALVIMALYPIHQTYGQLHASLFFSTGRTRDFRNLGLVTMLLGIPLGYFLTAPRSALGLEAGALGLAIKTVAVQFLSVNLLIYYNCRFLKVPFARNLAHQLRALIFPTLAAFFCHRLIHSSLIHASDLTKLIASGMAFSSISATVIYFRPQIISLSKDDFRHFALPAKPRHSPT